MEYIKRDFALDVVKRTSGDYAAAWAEIAHAPPADVAQVVHGKLISTGYDEMYCKFGDCTVCGADNPMSNKFCGQCGARMNLED